jgi:hypothetical protein
MASGIIHAGIPTRQTCISTRMHLINNQVQQPPPLCNNTCFAGTLPISAAIPFRLHGIHPPPHMISIHPSIVCVMVHTTLRQKGREGCHDSRQHEQWINLTHTSGSHRRTYRCVTPLLLFQYHLCGPACVHHPHPPCAGTLNILKEGGNVGP